MTDAIWKYELPIEDSFTLEMPVGAQVLSVQTQRDVACMWARVVLDSPKEKRQFRVIGTGNPIDYTTGPMSHLGTFQLANGNFVGHVFEVLP